MLIHDLCDIFFCIENPDFHPIFPDFLKKNKHPFMPSDMCSIYTQLTVFWLRVHTYLLSLPSFPVDLTVFVLITAGKAVPESNRTSRKISISQLHIPVFFSVFYHILCTIFCQWICRYFSAKKRFIWASKSYLWYFFTIKNAIYPNFPWQISSAGPVR